MVFLPFY